MLHRRWLYILAGFGINLTLGAVYSWSVFIKPLQTRFGATYFEATLPSTVALAMFAVGMLVAGRYVYQIGPRKTATVGAFLLGSGYILSSSVGSLPNSMWMLTLFYGTLVGVGLGFAYNPPIPTAAKWFPERKGLATGVVVMGFGLSPLVTAPLVQFLIGAYGVEAGFGILGMIFLFVTLLLASLLKFPPGDFVPPAVKTTWSTRKTSPTGPSMEPREMLRTPQFYVAILLYMLGTSVGFMAISQAKTIATETAHLETALAVAVVQWLAIWNCTGRPLFGKLTDAWGPRPVLYTMFAVELAGMGFLLYASSVPFLFLGIAMVAITFGGFLAVMPALTAYFFGSEKLGANYGIMFLGYGAGGILGPLAISAIRDATGGFSSAFVVGGIISTVGFILAAFVRPPKKIPSVMPPPPEITRVSTVSKGQV